MKAKKEVQEIQGTKQEFLKVFREMCYSRSAWQVWADLISMIACSLANSTDPDKAGVRYLEREQEYKQCAERLGGVDKPSRCMAVIVEALERNPEQDFLGELFMELKLGNHWKGQFFTPYCVCKAMSNMVTGDVDEQIEQRGYISVCDPACGAGATLIATVSEMKLSKYNFQNHVLFVGQDVDRVAGMMCYIQLSLLGCAGYICIGDTLTNPVTGHVLFPQEREGQEFWYMPMFRMDVWSLSKHLNMLFPQDSATAAKWFSIVQHRAQAKYYKVRELDLILLGRRRADGNYCGRRSNIYTDGKGVTRYSPLAAWSHEEILAYIHYHNVRMPPIYKWKKKRTREGSSAKRQEAPRNLKHRRLVTAIPKGATPSPNRNRPKQGDSLFARSVVRRYGCKTLRIEYRCGKSC